MVKWLKNPEIIGREECPILHRWTIIGWTGRQSKIPVKIMVHHFLPNADDRDVHDHPRPFLTVVLKGNYDDLAPCPGCETQDGVRRESCEVCKGRGLIVREHMKAGMIRYRQANHIHRTKVGPRGCWTFVVMGPLRRQWGFWRKGKWWHWRDYEREFGSGMHCSDD